MSLKTLEALLKLENVVTVGATKMEILLQQWKLPLEVAIVKKH